jgi:hypothetical protein
MSLLHIGLPSMAAQRGNQPRGLGQNLHKTENTGGPDIDPAEASPDSLSTKEDNVSVVPVIPLPQVIKVTAEIIAPDIDLRVPPTLFIPEKIFHILFSYILKELTIGLDDRGDVNRAKPGGQGQVQVERHQLK